MIRFVGRIIPGEKQICIKLAATERKTEVRAFCCNNNTSDTTHMKTVNKDMQTYKCVQFLF